MRQLPTNIKTFLDNKIIAMAGVSRTDGIGNALLKKFRTAGYTVYPVNPNAAEIQGEPCWPDVLSLPEKVNAVMITTPPEATTVIAKQCAEAGIQNIWMHRAFGVGSYSAEAERVATDAGINCITAGCPMMYVAPVDFGHTCIRWIMKLQGKL